MLRAWQGHLRDQLRHKGRPHDSEGACAPRSHGSHQLGRAALCSCHPLCRHARGGLPHDQVSHCAQAWQAVHNLHAVPTRAWACRSRCCGGLQVHSVHQRHLMRHEGMSTMKCSDLTRVKRTHPASACPTSSSSASPKSLAAGPVRWRLLTCSTSSSEPPSAAFAPSSSSTCSNGRKAGRHVCPSAPCRFSGWPGSYLVFRSCMDEQGVADPGPQEYQVGPDHAHSRWRWCSICSGHLHRHRVTGSGQACENGETCASEHVM